MLKFPSIQECIDSKETVCLTGPDAFKFCKDLPAGSIVVTDNVDIVDLAICSGKTSKVFILQGKAKRFARKFKHWFILNPEMGFLGYVHRI